MSRFFPAQGFEPTSIASPDRLAEGHQSADVLADQDRRDQLPRGKLFGDLLRIHEYERQRLGQELHDSAGQLVVALQLSIAQLKILEENSGHEGLIEEILDTVGQIDREIRSLAFLHYPAELGERGLCSALKMLIRGFGRRTGIYSTFEASGDVGSLDEPGQMALLRIAQEAIVNVHRHAHASSARLELHKFSDCVEIVISDDGIGIAADAIASSKGIGLQGMRHRVEALGGEFEVRALSRGTMVTARLPI